MKKNKAMRIAGALLVCTLLSTAVLSGTFAKYVTSDSASDSARVAKFGVTAEVTGNLFGKAYEKNDAATGADSITVSTNASATVSSNELVVAPGTKNNTGLTVKISGTPEVAYTISSNNSDVTAEDIYLAMGTYGVMVEATGLNAATDITKYYTNSGTTYTAAIGSWVSTNTYYKLIDQVTVSNKYYPITWTVTASGNAAAISTTSDLSTIAGKMLTGIAGTHTAGSASDAGYTLTWKWPISTNDGADTILGDIAAGANVVKKSGTNYTSSLTAADYNLKVKFGMKVTVTQVD